MRVGQPGPQPRTHCPHGETQTVLAIDAQQRQAGLSAGESDPPASLALAQPELKPVAGHAVSYAIRDPKGNVIFRKPEVTSRFGIASADCPLADEIAEGPYQVQCQLGDTTSTATVNKKIRAAEVQNWAVARSALLRAGPKGPRTIDARYFFGKPVATPT